MTGVQTCALPICFPVTIRVGVAPSLMGAHGTLVENKKYEYKNAVSQSVEFYKSLEDLYAFSSKRLIFVGQSTGARIIVEMAKLLHFVGVLPKNSQFEMVAPYLFGKSQLEIFNGPVGFVMHLANMHRLPGWFRKPFLVVARILHIDRAIINNRLSGLIKDSAISPASDVHAENQQDIALTTRWTDVILDVAPLDFDALPAEIQRAVRVHTQDENIVDHIPTLEFVKKYNLPHDTYDKGHVS